jgi:hypothetical protein
MMPRGKTQRSLELIDACYAILETIQPATIRAVCYQLFIGKLLASMAKTCTNRVSTQLVYAREAGIVPWEWVVDETRDPERPGTWENPDNYIQAVLNSYRRDRWNLQGRRIEVWSEKGTVRGTLAPVLAQYGVTFRVMHGHGSATALHDAALETQDDRVPRTILYIGDHDPSGRHMSDMDIPERLARYEGSATVLRLRWLVMMSTRSGVIFPPSPPSISAAIRAISGLCTATVKPVGNWMR